MNELEDLVSIFQNINISLIEEENVNGVLANIAVGAQEVTNSDGVFLFVINEDKFLNLEYSNIKSLKWQKTGAENRKIFPNLFLSAKNSKRFPVEICALNQEVINEGNLSSVQDMNLENIRRFDNLLDYSTVSFLAIPLVGRNKKILGILQLINAQGANGKVISYTSSAVEKAQSFASLASILLENGRLKEAYGQLLESFIEVLARAIDAKSPYTGAHCQRVPVIARLLATAAVQSDVGSLKTFEMSKDDWYALHIASWLHDCGKITTPEYVVDKATKLETIYNRIHEVRDRFEILRRDAQIEYLQKRLADVDKKENLQKEFAIKVKQLEDDFAFIAECNIGDKNLKEDDISRLKKISGCHFMRYFNRGLGLSWAERDALKNIEDFSKPGWESVLQNRPEHLVGEYNKGELYNLLIPYGTINENEREKINEHIEVTIDMLKALPFPSELSKVVEYAGSHHERIDGKGYPNGLTGEQMSVPAKIMAIADVFEALTANDRPYKEPKKLSEVLKIMQEMKNTGHIDPDLYKVFILSRVYMDYAEQYVGKDQIDEINPEEYL